MRRDRERHSGHVRDERGPACGAVHDGGRTDVAPVGAYACDSAACALPVGAFAAPLLAVFVLGLFIPRATPTGVFFGTFAGATLAVLFTFSDAFAEWFSMWVFVVGFVSSVVFSLLFSIVPGLKLMSGTSQDRTYWAVVKDDSPASSESEPSGSR